MGTNFRDLLNERLQNEDFKKEYESLEPEYELVKAFLEARKNADMTQSELRPFGHSTGRYKQA